MRREQLLKSLMDGEKVESQTAKSVIVVSGANMTGMA